MNVFAMLARNPRYKDRMPLVRAIIRSVSTIPSCFLTLSDDDFSSAWITVLTLYVQKRALCQSKVQ